METKFQNFKQISLWLLVLFTALPFLVLCLYNHPSVDDICYVQRAIEYGFWETQLMRYREWTGRFSSTFLISCYATVSHQFVGYRLLPIIFMGLQAWSLAYFFNAWFQNRLSNKTIWALVAIIIVFYLYGMPEIVQSVYWMTGYVTYQFPIILILFLLGYILKNQLILKVDLSILVSGLACIMITAANETAMIFWLIILSTLLAAQWLSNRSWSRYLLFLFFLTGIVATIVILAPGNEVRGGGFIKKHQFLYSISQSIITSIWFAKTKLLKTPLILLLVLYLPIGLRIKRTDKITSIKKLSLVLIVSSLLYYSTFFPTYWSMGGPPPTRVLNVSFFLILVAGLISVQTIIDFTSGKFLTHRLSPPWWIQGISIILIVLFLVKPNNINQAYVDWLSGSARQYSKEVGNRQFFIKNCPEALCELPSYKNRPSTIYFDDITNDPTDWRNKCYAPVYGKQQVKWK